MNTQLFTQLPPVGAWRLLGAYEGFEVVYFTPRDNGMVFEGTSLGVEQGIPWSMHYAIEIADTWRVRHATVTNLADLHLNIQTDGTGIWVVDGQRRPELDGCLDLDFEASVVTNTLPVHRLALAVGQQGTSGAVYIRSRDLAVERLDQVYRRLPDVAGELRFDYESPRFGYRDTLHFASDGLAMNYPGIGIRVPLKA